MRRYITIELCDGIIWVFGDGSTNWKTALDSEDVACWVWQFAEDRQSAIAQHIEKYDEYESDLNSGNEPKETY